MANPEGKALSIYGEENLREEIRDALERGELARQRSKAVFGISGVEFRDFLLPHLGRAASFQSSTAFLYSEPVTFIHSIKTLRERSVYSFVVLALRGRCDLCTGVTARKLLPSQLVGNRATLLHGFFHTDVKPQYAKISHYVIWKGGLPALCLVQLYMKWGNSSNW